MAAQLFNEKREYTRIESNRLVSVQQDTGQIKRFVAINYSSGGMALHSHSPLQLGEFIEMSFRLNEFDSDIIDMTAEVVQNFKEGNAYIIGVKFVGTLAFEYADKKESNLVM